MLESYPSIYQVGHKQADNIFDGDVVVQEKVDGSQFSFGIIDGVLQIKSKGKMIDPDIPPKMFARAVQTVLDKHVRLEAGITYRGEVLDKPKHNTIAYERVPEGNIILFDASFGGEHYATVAELQLTADFLGFEVVPTFYEGPMTSVLLDEFLKRIPNTMSILGDSVPIEGFVFKNYNQFGMDKKMLMCKLTSENFKERNNEEWQKPTRKDVVEIIGMALNTEARFNKAIQHLEEQDILVYEPKDIGFLIRELNEDMDKEEVDFIKDALYNHFKKDIYSRATRGFPEYYKQRLMDRVPV